MLQLTDVHLGEVTSETLDLTWPVDEETRVDQLIQGTWWIQPLARRSDDILGLFLQPGKEQAQCPVVLSSGSEAVTIASSMATAVPMFLYLSQLIPVSKKWHRFRQRWPELEEDLLPLHLAMGGTDRLEGFRQVLFDDELLEHWEVGLSPERRHENHRKAFERLDPSPENILHRRHLCQAGIEFLASKAPVDIASADDFSMFGAWRTACAVATFHLARIYHRTPALLTAAWEVACRPAGLDTGQSGIDPYHFPCGMLADGAPLQTAQALAKHAAEVETSWTRDPLWPAVMALAEQGLSYQGVDHVRAAQLLDEELKQSERAYQSLISAAFWSFTALGASVPAMMDAATWLAEKSGWTDLHTHLLEMATYRSLL
jgi:hypothetical protein